MLKLSENALGMLVAKYRAVLKKMSLENSVALLLCASFFCAAPAWAATVDYTDTEAATGSGLQISTIGGANSPSLFPSTASGNIVTVDFRAGFGTNKNPYRVFGGLSSTEAVTGNTVYFKNGNTTSTVYGGHDASGLGYGADQNKIFMSGGKVDGHLIGGFSANGNAVNNEVLLTDGTVGNIYGGNVTQGGNAENNTVTIAGGTAEDVKGGYIPGGKAIENTVNIWGGTINKNVLGGESDNGDAGGNTVNITGVTIGQGSAGYVYGGYSFGGSGTVENNTVNIKNVTINQGVVGGYSYNGDVTGNRVDIWGGTINKNVLGGESDSGDVSGNSVTISGSSVGGDVYGGLSNSGNATSNSVTLSGSSVGGDVYGGYSNVAGDVFAGNVLSVNSAISVGGNVGNFQNYSFLLPSAITSGDTMLTVDGTADLTDGGGQSSVVQNINILGGGRAQQVGETFTLIHAGTLNSSGLNTTASGRKGVFLFYDYDLATTGNTLTATVTGAGFDPQAKAFSEGRAAGMGFLNRGGDLLADRGINDALSKTKEAKDGKEFFGAVSYGSSRYDTGSHVDVDGISLLTGIAFRSDTENGSLVKGIFLEGGWGNYDGYNSFTNAPNVKSDGDTSYWGLGALIRRDMASGSYLEGSLRGGKSKTTFNSGDFVGAGQNVSYSSKPAYYGAHIGAGKIKKNGDKSTDYYAKYFWTHQNGDDVNVLGDPVSFSSSDSSRLRAGVRLSKEKQDSRTATYAGLAYEYEFGGKAKATVFGHDIDAPSLKGGTGIVELGVSFKTGAKSDNKLNLSLQGYMGQRKGLGGSVRFMKMF